jgi:hypothetical protein
MSVEDTKVVATPPVATPSSAESDDPIVEAYKKGVDMTLIRRNLSMSVEERFEQLMSLQKFAEELRAAGKRARNE